VPGVMSHVSAGTDSSNIQENKLLPFLW